MIVAIEGLKAEVIVVDIPQFDGEVGRARSEISPLMVIVYIIHWV